MIFGVGFLLIMAAITVANIWDSISSSKKNKIPIYYCAGAFYLGIFLVIVSIVIWILGVWL
jgi:hypothetical protein